jgi:NAD-dependent dihydropyrimidine dehydrogenase PreA subunit
MNCKCGGNTVNAVHQVKTLKKAVEYQASLNQQDLPITVDKDTCPSCGRCEINIITTKH